MTSFSDRQPAVSNLGRRRDNQNPDAEEGVGRVRVPAMYFDAAIVRSPPPGLRLSSLARAASKWKYARRHVSRC